MPTGMSGESKGVRASGRGALFAAAGAALVVGFFLAWIGPFTGLDVARMNGWKNHLYAIAPILGAGLAYYGLTDVRRARALGVLAGVVVLGWCAYSAGHDVAAGLEWGGWIAVVGAVGLVASGAVEQKGLAAIAGAIAAVGFFLPWFGGASGFDIARGAGVDGFAARLAPVWLSLGGALLGAIGGFGEHRGPRIAALGGLLVIGGILWPYVALADLVLGAGAWLTLAGAATALGVGLTTRRS